MSICVVGALRERYQATGTSDHRFYTLAKRFTVFRRQGAVADTVLHNSQSFLARRPTKHAQSMCLACCLRQSSYPHANGAASCIEKRRSSTPWK